MPAKDIALVKTVQKVVDGRAAFRLDANQAYTAERGRRDSSRRSIPTGIELFEQPCAAGDWDAHLAVTRVAQVPMMLDESIYGLADIEKAARLEAATYLKLKLMKLVTLDALVEGDRPHPGTGDEAGPRQRRGLRSGLLDGRLHRGAADRQRRGNERLPQGALRRCCESGLEFRDGAMRLKAGYAPRLDRAALDDVRRRLPFNRRRKA